MNIYIVQNKLFFPEIKESDGDIIAIGGDLSEERLLLAYKSGIFPWFSEHEPIIWWSPNPRFVLFPEQLKISKSMRKCLKDERFTVTYNANFKKVIHNCKLIKRKNQDSTWITDEMEEAYISLHNQKLAHSVEVWENNELVGGLYGVYINNVFFGESMFSIVSNASKFGFIKFVQKFKSEGGNLIDCQVYTEHLSSLGACHIRRKEFLKRLRVNGLNPF